MKLKMTVLRSTGGAVPEMVARSGWTELVPAGPDAGVRRGSGGASGSRGGAISVELDTSELSAKEVRDHSRDPDVLAIAPEMPVQLIKPATTNGTPAGDEDSPPAESWGVEAVGARRSGRNGQGVVVAILDTGIVKDHPAFKGVEFREGDEENFTDEANVDLDGHGTHCAGTILGRNCRGCEIGIAPGITRALIGKVIGKGGGSTEAIYRAMLWAQQKGAHVISMSLGMDFPGYQSRLVRDYGLEEEHATSLALAGYRANVRLFDRMSQVVAGRDGVVGGSVVVAAAGNESKRPNYSITVAPPAAAELFLAVGAVGREPSGKLLIAPFSNDGVGLVGPGVDIWSADKKDGVHRMSGTSMAAPHVAGVAALWAEPLVRDRRFKASTVIDLVRRSALKLEGFNEVDVGEGLVQAPQGPSIRPAERGGGF